ncbi:glycoside hydrolase [Paenibacillus sp. 598K]|nr:glycoside hydrolase [Paenibacillus sp. 598K]
MGFYKNQWRLYESMELGHEINPAISYMKAKIPGSVQTDLMTSGWLADPNIGLASLEGEWVNNREWVYETNFSLPEDWLEDRCELVFEGLDYSGEIHLNGKRLAMFEGMFIPVRLDVTDRLRTDGPNRLLVVFHTAPDVDGQFGYSNQIRKLKSRFNYAWDWCPRIVPVGIWRDVYLHTYSDAKINDFYPQANVEDNMADGEVRFTTEVTVERRGTYTISYTVTTDQGEQKACAVHTEELRCGTYRIEHELAVPDIALWWPNGYGKQPLYRVGIEIADEQQTIACHASKSIGFRSVQCIPNPGSPEQALPYTLVVNGRRIFMKGVNWVPIRPFYGDVQADEYADYLGRFKAMNANMLRVWGGAIIEKQAFYEYCDANGLMVWQEFLQSSSGINNTPPDDPRFLDELEQVASHAIKEKRAHPSLVIWCGGNELMWEGFKPVDERHANIARLEKIVAALDPGRIFLPTSASGPRFTADIRQMGKGLHHDVHGPWVYLEEEHYAFFNQDDSLLLSEMGTPGVARAENIEKYAIDCSAWPPTKDNPYWVHRGAWWIQWEQLNRLFGEWSREHDELQLYSQASRYVQMESLRYAIEATRRREPASSGFIIWMGNEPYANNSNTSVIEYDGMVKPAYYAVKDAFASRHISARYDKIKYSEGERFACSLYWHDESGADGDSFEVLAEVVGVDGTVYKQQRYSCASGPSATQAGELEWIVAAAPYALFFLRLQVRDRDHTVVSSNTYLYSLDLASPYRPLRQLPNASLAIELGEQGQLHIRNVSDIAAVGVMVQEKEASRFASFDRNYLSIFPGESVTVTCSMLPIDTVEQFVVNGFNLE